MTDFSVANLHAVDRAVRTAVVAYETWGEALARSPENDAIFDQAPLARHREVAGQTTFAALSASRVVSQEEAWREALRRWVGVLTVRRVTEALVGKQAKAEAEKSASVRLETVMATSFREGWTGLLRSRNVVEASAWLHAIALRGPAVAAILRERAENEDEVARRLGFSDLSDLVEGTRPFDLAAAAQTFLKETRDLAVALRAVDERRGDAGGSSFLGVVLAARGRDAPEGWPAGLSTRTLVESLHAPQDIGRGIRVRIAPPEIVGAATFARSLESFGIAYRRSVATASSMPFALAFDPHFVDAHRFGFAFGALPTTTVYQQRGLGLVARVAAQQARAMSASALLHARGLAIAFLLSRRASRPDKARFEELTHDVYGAGVPASLFGLFPRPRSDVAARLEALLGAPAFTGELRDRFDEDWFRNPQAWRQLRTRASGPARSTELDQAPEPVALARAFEEALG